MKTHSIDSISIWDQGRLPPKILCKTLHSWYIKIMKTLFIFLVSSLFFVSCISKPPTIPLDANAEKLIQLAQEEYDKNRYDNAMEYYRAVIDMYPSRIDSICAAEYEIAFIHYKQKKYGEAKKELDQLLIRYEHPEAETYPIQYKILAGIVIKSIEEKGK
jgi:outer membrane protein assembly factor BamD (BamD/ComL family)